MKVLSQAGVLISAFRLLFQSPAAVLRVCLIGSQDQQAAAVCNCHLQHARTLRSTAMYSAGHNKWSKIKRKKAVADQERSKVTSKMVYQIISAVRITGSSDPDMNMRLSSAISRARDAGIPKTTIENAIQVGVTKQTAAQMAEHVLYEGRGPTGYMVLIEALTENQNRTRPELKQLLKKYGGNLGEPGSSSFAFEHKGIIRVPREEVSQSPYPDPLELAIDIGAEDVVLDDENEEDRDDCYQLKCHLKDLKLVTDTVREKGFNVSSATLEYIPISLVSLSHESYQKATKLLELLSDHNDVMEVYANFVLESQ